MEIILRYLIPTDNQITIAYEVIFFMIKVCTVLLSYLSRSGVFLLKNRSFDGFITSLKAC